MALQATQVSRGPGKPSIPAAPTSTRTAKDASGINADDRGPIHPAMPHLPPA